MQFSEAISVAASGSPSRSAHNFDNADAALIDKITAGDQRALQVLYARHGVRIYRFAQRLLRDESAAEDTLSEVFLDVWQQAGRFERRSQVATWLLGITRNKALSCLRRRSTAQLDDEIVEFIEDTSDTPEAALQKQERSEILRECLQRLSPAHREIIDLVYYHEQTVEEVSAIIGVPVNTVKTRMFYARKRIAEMMSERGISRAAV